MYTHIEDVLAGERALAARDKRARVVAEAAPVSERLAREREPAQVVVHQQVERIRLQTSRSVSKAPAAQEGAHLEVDEVRPVVPEPR